MNPSTSHRARCGIDVFNELNGLATVATCTVHDDRLNAVAK